MQFFEKRERERRKREREKRESPFRTKYIYEQWLPRRVLRKHGVKSGSWDRIVLEFLEVSRETLGSNQDMDVRTKLRTDGHLQAFVWRSCVSFFFKFTCHDLHNFKSG